MLQVVFPEHGMVRPSEAHPWYPRPRGAAPHGPGGVPKRWNHSNGTWEALPPGSEAAMQGLAMQRDLGPRLVPRPRGAVCRRDCPAAPAQPPIWILER